MGGHDTQDLIKKSIWNNNRKGWLLNLNLILLRGGVSQCILFVDVQHFMVSCTVLFHETYFFLFLFGGFLCSKYTEKISPPPSPSPFGGQRMTQACNRLKRRDPVWWVNRIFSRQVLWAELWRIEGEENGRNRVNQILLFLWEAEIKVWFPELIFSLTPER